MNGRMLRRPAFLGAAALAAVLGLAACAAGPVRVAARPGPARPAEKPGPWGTTIAVYDPSLYGPDVPLSRLVAERHLRLEHGKLRHARILVNKAQRRLELWVKRRMIKAYRIQLGWHAQGPKIRQGDLRTPEGTYFVCAKKPSAYYLGLWLSYPNAADALRGLESGLISRKEYDAILTDLKDGRCPPVGTKLGGDILIHGQIGELTAEMTRKHKADPSTLPRGWLAGDADPTAFRDYQDWTNGCVALFNPDLREVYEYVAEGTEVLIVANAAVTKPRSPDGR